MHGLEAGLFGDCAPSRLISMTRRTPRLVHPAAVPGPPNHLARPFPFSLLNVVVSFEAIVLTRIVLMTQSRMPRKVDKRAYLDLQANLLEEQEL
jgi:Protein of unknown function (DUF1003)